MQRRGAVEVFLTFSHILRLVFTPCVWTHNTSAALVLMDLCLKISRRSADCSVHGIWNIWNCYNDAASKILDNT